jgi:hypothetical protein
MDKFFRVQTVNTENQSNLTFFSTFTEANFVENDLSYFVFHFGGDFLPQILKIFQKRRRKTFLKEKENENSNDEEEVEFPRGKLLTNKTFTDQQKVTKSGDRQTEETKRNVSKRFNEK